MDIALGFSQYLHRFAKARNASSHWNWNRDGLAAIPTGPFRTFEQAFLEAAQNAQRIHFNLEGIADPVLAADSGRRFGFVAGNMTNAELEAIRSASELLHKTIFYAGGAVVASPF